MTTATKRIYLRRHGRDVWHFHPLCHHYKRLASSLDPDVDESKMTTPTSGERCNECLAKAKRDRG